jgi:hypothetical protein
MGCVSAKQIHLYGFMQLCKNMTFLFGGGAKNICSDGPIKVAHCKWIIFKTFVLSMHHLK